MFEKNHVLFEVGLQNLYAFQKRVPLPWFLPSLQVWVIMELWSLRFMEETWSNSSTYRPSPRLGHYGNRSFLEMLICLKTLMCCSKYGFKVHKMAKAWSSLSNYVTMNVSEWELLSVSGSESAILRILFWSQWKISFWSHWMLLFWSQWKLLFWTQCIPLLLQYDRTKAKITRLKRRQAIPTRMNVPLHQFLPEIKIKLD